LHLVPNVDSRAGRRSPRRPYWVKTESEAAIGALLVEGAGGATVLESAIVRDRFEGPDAEAKMAASRCSKGRRAGRRADFLPASYRGGKVAADASHERRNA
jgi:hypothetical protein